jgi:hypothetical protein
MTRPNLPSRLIQVVPADAVGSTSFHEEENIGTVISNLCEKDCMTTPASFLYTVITMMSRKPYTSLAVVDSIHAADPAIYKRRMLFSANMATPVQVADFGTIFRSLKTQAQLFSSKNMIVLVLLNFLMYMMMPFVFIVAPLSKNARGSLNSVMGMLGFSMTWRSKAVSFLTVQWFISILISSAIIASCYAVIFLPYRYVFSSSKASIGDDGIAAESASCATILEAAGPGLLYICVCLMAASYAAGAVLQLADEGAHMMWMHGGHFLRDVPLESGASSVSIVFMKFLQEMGSYITKRYRHWLARQWLCALIVPIPYIVSPFYSRSLFSCPLLGNSNMDMFLIFTGNTINYTLAGTVVFWLAGCPFFAVRVYSAMYGCPFLLLWFTVVSMVSWCVPCCPLRVSWTSVSMCIVLQVHLDRRSTRPPRLDHPRQTYLEHKSVRG